MEDKDIAHELFWDSDSDVCIPADKLLPCESESDQRDITHNGLTVHSLLTWYTCNPQVYRGSH
jgi:hypothetical protein